LDERRTRVLLPSLAAVILDRTGGVLLHAAGVVMDGKAVLFVGPSGAGKTTATQLCRGCELFTGDRAAITFESGRARVWALPGGDPADVIASDATNLPLAAVLRVAQRRDGVTSVKTLDRAHSVGALRESMFRTRRGVEDEKQALAIAEALSRLVPVGIVGTSLGVEVTDAIRHWLETT
jgi:ABC-type branched-subunit amino acid transport system ATPase component